MTTTKKPLELIWYVCIECGDTRCYIIDDDKHLTNGELAIEWNRSAAVTAIHGHHTEGNRTKTIHDFLTRPHASENGYQ